MSYPIWYKSPATDGKNLATQAQNGETHVRQQRNNRMNTRIQDDGFLVTFQMKQT